MKKQFILVLLRVASVSCCVDRPANHGNATNDPYYCTADPDCEIKDVHNCCGYYNRG